MSEGRGLFSAREPSDASIIVRMSKAQKEFIRRMADRRGVSISRFILDLVGELERLECKQICEDSKTNND